MKASIVTAVANLVGAIIIAASVFLGFQKMWDQKEKHHYNEMFVLDKIRSDVRHLSINLP